MIKLGSKEIASYIFIDAEKIARQGSEVWWIDERRIPHLVWQSVRSCFGAGFWRNDKPWLNNEAWRNE